MTHLPRFTTTLLLLLMTLFLHNDMIGQSNAINLYSVITKSGDTLRVSKIYEGKTNEDRVTFERIGKKTLLASEVKYVLYKGRYTSIEIAGVHKLVKIRKQGVVSLAISKSTDGYERYYVKVNDKWYDLYPHYQNLRTFLSAQIPDLEKSNPAKTIHYNLASLTKVINDYNDYKNPKSQSIGRISYKIKDRFQIFGTAGISQLSLVNFAADFAPTFNYTIGVESHIEFSRHFATRIQVSYNSSTWNQTPNWDMELKSLNLSTLLSTKLLHNYRSPEFSIAMGPAFNISANSQFIVGPDNSSSPVGLKGIGFGYEIQVHCLVKKQLNVFASFHAMERQKTQLYGTIKSAGNFIAFKTYTMKIGAGYSF